MTFKKIIYLFKFNNFYTAMIDRKEMAREYALGYKDKSRIYFIERNLSTFDGTCGRNVPFELFPRQKVYCHALGNDPKIISIKHRQCGISTTSCAWITGQLVYAPSESPETVLCIANKLDQACELLFKIRDFLEQVPRWYWGSEYYSPDPNSEKNKKSIFIKNSKSYLELVNGCKVYARAAGPNSARGISSVSILIFDEAAFMEEGVAAYASAVAATSAVKNAKIIMVSTPNGKDQLYYQTYKQGLEKRNGYTVVEFKWYQDLRYNRFLKWHRKNEKTGVEEWVVEDTIDDEGRINYEPDKWRDLEKQGWKPTSPWYERMCESFNNDSQKIAQELDVSFLGSSDNVVSPDVIEKIRLQDVCDPLADYGDPLEDETWFWKRPIEGHRYILAIDPSLGSSADRTSIQVIDADETDEHGLPCLSQVMEYNGRILGDKLGDLAYRYATLFNNAYVVVDATGGSGDACLLRLMNYYGYTNLYYDDNVVKDYMKVTQKSSENYAERMPGIHFQGKRFALLRNFANMVMDGSIIVKSIRLCNELDTWIFKTEDGKMDHMAGSHDDNITCMATALFVFKYHFLKLQSEKSKDAAILNSYMCSGGYRPKNTLSQMYNGQTVTPKSNHLPMYTGNSVGKSTKSISPYMWVFGKI